jgi:hypothetical protein
MEDQALNGVPKFCGNCGAAIVPGDRFCGHCGSTFGVEAAAQQPSSRDFRPAVPKRQFKRRAWLWLVAVILLGVAITAGFWAAEEYFPSEEGMYSRGMLYFQGEGGYPKDPVKAAEWFRPAAEKGSVSAAEMLGRMYQDGIGVSKDDRQAFYWWNLAYTLEGTYGHPDSQAQVGIMYLHGSGVTKDVEKGLDLCRQAAERGSADAQFALGRIYVNTMSFDEWNKGLEWFRQAARQGHEAAQTELRKRNIRW